MHSPIERIQLPQLSADASYLIAAAGSLSYLSSFLMKWYVAHGAKHIVLISEEKITQEVEETIRELEKSGIHIATHTNSF